MEALVQEVAKPAYYGMPDWQVAEVLNTPSAEHGTINVPLHPNQARRLLAISGAWTAMGVALEGGNASASTATAIRNVMDILTLTEALNETEVQTLSAHLNVLVTAGLVTAQTKTQIENQARRARSWSEENGVEVTARTVGLARGAR